MCVSNQCPRAYLCDLDLSTAYLLPVRCGIAISVVFFTVNIICLLLEAILRLSGVHVRQVTRSANVGCLAATCGGRLTISFLLFN